MPPRPLKQTQILEALKSAYERTGTTPDLSSLARSFGITYHTLREHLKALEAKGKLVLESRGPGRTPRLRLLGAAVGVPLYGEIAARLPVGTYPEPEADLVLRGRPGTVALPARAHPMAD